MTHSVDTEIRAAALEKVRQLRGAYGGRIPKSALLEGITLEGQRVSIWNPQQGIFKPKELGRDGAALSIQTSFKSPYNDSHDIDSGSIAYKYRGTDPMHRDNVALRYAMVRQLPMIYLVAVDPGFYDAIAPIYVSSDSPATLEFTLQADQVAWVDGAHDAANTAPRREYATRAILARLHQQKFRRVVLAAYGDQCCICRLRHLELLDAAHILADSHPSGEPIVPNGLGMCKIHHSAYDANIIGIDPDTVVHVRGDILLEKDGPMLKHGLQEMAGRILVRPRKPELRPYREFLAERYERFCAA